MNCFCAVFATIAVYGVYANLKVDAMSDLMLANVEALALGEMNSGYPNECTNCLNSCCRCFKIYRDMREIYLGECYLSLVCAK